VQPDEVLPDPVLEERARDISAGLRCIVCRNESIDESNAELARDLRLLVRERLVAGDSDEEVVAYIVDRYGEYVLLRPPMTGSTVALWLAAPVLMLLGLGLSVAYVRRRSSAAAPTEGGPVGGRSRAAEGNPQRLTQRRVLFSRPSSASVAPTRGSGSGRP
jgi:cytochrome c-type biogenesis protein CcmH